MTQIPNTIPPNDKSGLMIWLELLRNCVASLETRIKELEDKIKELESENGGE